MPPVTEKIGLRNGDTNRKDDEVVWELVCKRLDLEKCQNYEISIQGLLQ
jgi:hypothetical protein